jgi:hypothetical protein
MISLRLYRWVAIAAVCGYVTANAQSNAIDAAIEGYVRDATGGAIQRARVTVRNVSTNVETQTITNPAGYFRFPLLQVGTYGLLPMPTVSSRSPSPTWRGPRTENATRFRVWSRWFEIGPPAVSGGCLPRSPTRSSASGGGLGWRAKSEATLSCSTNCGSQPSMPALPE